jgi:phosphatidylserine decarboxylase
MVGSIVQHQPEGGYCTRGGEKGYFQMGGSTVLTILEPGRVKIDEDILHHSRQDVETLVQYGEKVGEIL